MTNVIKTRVDGWPWYAGVVDISKSWVQYNGTPTRLDEVLNDLGLDGTGEFTSIDIGSTTIAQVTEGRLSADGRQLAFNHDIYVDDPEYGAVGNGVTSDAAAFRAAAAAATGGARIVLTGGKSYLLDDYVQIAFSGVTIEGNGAEIISDEMDRPIFIVGSHTDATVKPADVTFKNIRFRQTETLANPDGTSWVSGYLTNEHVSAAIFHAHGDRLKVLNCRFENLLYGVSYWNWDTRTTQAEGLDIIGCEFDGCNFGALVGNAVKDFRFHGNVARDTQPIIQFTDDGTPDPPHMLYVTGGTEFQSRSARVSAIGNVDYGNTGITGSSLKFKGVDGLVCSDNLSVSTTGAIEFGYCTDVTGGGNQVRDLVEDTVSTVAQGALRMYGCSNVFINGMQIELTGAGTQAVSMVPLAATDITPEPGSNLTNTDCVLANIVVDYNVSGSSPLSPFYIDTGQRITILNPIIKRTVSKDMTVFNIQNNDAGLNTDDVRIINPMIWADSGDTYRHQTAFVETGATNVRFVIDPARLINVDDRAAAFISDSGTGTVIERVLSYSNARGKAISGRSAWNLTTSHLGTIESAAAAIFEIITGNASIGALYFGDVDASGRGRIDYDHSTNTFKVYTNGGQKFQLNASGLDLTSGAAGVQLLVNGAVKLDTSGGIRFAPYTAAQIADITHAVNTIDKAKGKAVLDDTNGRIMVATGSTAGSTWSVADGSATVTPA